MDRVTNLSIIQYMISNVYIGNHVLFMCTESWKRDRTCGGGEGGRVLEQVGR